MEHNYLIKTITAGFALLACLAAPGAFAVDLKVFEATAAESGGGGSWTGFASFTIDADAGGVWTPDWNINYDQEPNTTNPLTLIDRSGLPLTDPDYLDMSGLLSFAAEFTDGTDTYVFGLSDLVAFHLGAIDGGSVDHFNIATNPVNGPYIQYFIDLGQGNNNTGFFCLTAECRTNAQKIQMTWSAEQIPEPEAVIPTIFAGLMGLLLLRRRKQSAGQQFA